MNATNSELLSLIDAVNRAVEELLASNAELTEGFLEDQNVEANKKKLEALKAELSAQRVRLDRAKEAKDRKAALKKLRNVSEA